MFLIILCMDSSYYGTILCIGGTKYNLAYSQVPQSRNLYIIICNYIATSMYCIGDIFHGN